jgi:hypothetical protein
MEGTLTEIVVGYVTAMFQIAMAFVRSFISKVQDQVELPAVCG